MGRGLRCPRCGGMIYVERLLGDEADLVCIQCGYRSPWVAEAEEVPVLRAA